MQLNIFHCFSDSLREEITQIRNGYNGNLAIEYSFFCEQQQKVYKL